MHTRILIAGFVALSLLAPSGAAFADPPPWAPAHGYRDKHGGKHDGKHKGKHRDHDDDDDDDRRHHRGGRIVWHDHYDRARFPGHPQYFSLPLGLERGTCDRSRAGAALGTLLGAVAGGLGGAQIGRDEGQVAATIGGVLLGAALGNVLGGSLDPADRACLVQTLERAPDGERIVWDVPGDRTRYGVQPVQTWSRDGRHCREYTTTVSVGGRLEEGYGTACREPDGSWRIMK